MGAVDDEGPRCVGKGRTALIGKDRRLPGDFLNQINSSTRAVACDGVRQLLPRSLTRILQGAFEACGCDKINVEVFCHQRVELSGGDVPHRRCAEENDEKRFQARREAEHGGPPGVESELAYNPYRMVNYVSIPLLRCQAKMLPDGKTDNWIC